METILSIGASLTDMWLLMFETIGLIGRLSISPLAGNLCNFVVP